MIKMKNFVFETKQMRIECPKCKKTYIRVIPEYDDAVYSMCPHCTNIVALPNKVNDAMESFSPDVYLSKDCKPIKKSDRATEVENVSELIRQMAIKGSQQDEMINAVKYSMVCIDSDKSVNGAYIDVKKAYDDLHISQLFKKYAVRTRSLMRS